MKQLIVFTLLVSFQSSYAQDLMAMNDSPSKDCKKTKGILTPAKETELSKFEKLTNGLEADNLKILASQLCGELIQIKTYGREEPGKDIENIILKHMGISRETENYKLEVAKFWNINAKELICKFDLPGTRSPQQFMKRIIDMRMYKTVLYEFLLYDEDDYPITVNAVEVYNGEKETVLDYLDNILADPANEKKYNFKEIKSLRDLLIIGYGAKKANEL